MTEAQKLVQKALSPQDRERAVEITAHNVAACIHAALVHKRMTVKELKQQITDWDPELVDSVLLGVQPDKIKCTHLADLAFILEFDWQFTVRALEPREAVAQAA